MKILFDWNCNGGGNGCIGPVVPSPIPPWLRPVQNPRTNTMSVSGTIDLSFDTTYFDNLISDNDGANPPVDRPWQIVLPNGNWKRQSLTLMIPGSNIPTSAANWVVTGTFAGFATLTFDALGTNALLMWDGSAWAFFGGNATQK